MTDVNGLSGNADDKRTESSIDGVIEDRPFDTGFPALR